jgi:hypothetical protein
MNNHCGNLPIETPHKDYQSGVGEGLREGEKLGVAIRKKIPHGTVKHK